MVNARRPQTGDQLLLRFPEGSDLRGRLQVKADANNRTVTMEIVHRLEKSIAEDEAAGVPDFTEPSSTAQLLQEIAALRAEVRELARKVSG